MFKVCNRFSAFSVCSFVIITELARYTKKNSRGYPVVSELFFKQKIEIFLFNKLFGTDVIILWHFLPIAVS